MPLRKRVWVASPAYYLFSVVMLGMAALSWPNRILCVSELAAAVLSAVVIAILTVRMKVRTSAVIRSAKQVFTAKEYDAFDSFALPVAIVGEAGDILWYNNAFYKSICLKKDCVGDSISKFLYPRTLKQAISESGVGITIGSRQFTLYGCRTSGGSLLYFVDDTYYKRISREYGEKRPAVVLISFDNRDELSMGTSSMDDAKIASALEAVLVIWARDMGGFIRRLGDNRYVMMTDEIHIAHEKEKRFDILDRVREIKNEQNYSATISVGIGRGATTLEESERWARQALDMALGRGGDQVAIKQKGDSYEFFGGVSKGVEKRDKVRTRVIAATLSDTIAACDTVLIMGHNHSDLDSLGAAIGMWAAVTRGLQKRAYVVINKAQSLAKPMLEIMEQTYAEETIFLSPDDALDLVTKKTMVIVVDTHSPTFVEVPELLDIAGNIVVIDHHRMMVKHIKNAVVFYHEPYASSASEMVAELVQYIGSSVLTRTEANLLLAGIMLDTKGFVLKTGVRTFEAAAYLRRRGADTVQVKRMFADSFETYLAKTQIISQAEISEGCAVACTEESIPDIRIVAAQAADELLNIQGVTVSFVIFSENGGANISARSMGDVNVQVILERLGGGGHHSMAGAQLKGVTVEQAKAQLLAAIREQQG